MTISEQIDAAVEQLISLDEIAGELSDEDNATVDRQRTELKAQIDRLVAVEVM